jgi:thiol-disulfide isomerase/thioredoxin
LFCLYYFSSNTLIHSRHDKLNIFPAIPAPEFKDIFIWANSEPLSIKDLKGRVILLDCMKYTCIFCLRTIPIIKHLQQKLC